MRKYIFSKPFHLFIFIIFGFIWLSSCKSASPVVPTPEPNFTINLENPLFVEEDSCRAVPLPSPGNTGEYNEFPDSFFSKTIANNPENSCEYLAWVTATEPFDQFFEWVDICKGTTTRYDFFPPGTHAFPIWGPNDWFLFVVQGEIWKMKSNGDNREKIIPNNSDDRFYNIFLDPTDENSFFFTQKSDLFKSDIEGENIDTLSEEFILPGTKDLKALGYIEGESLGYRDLTTGEYIPISSKYKRNFGGSWLPNGHQAVWLAMEEPRSYPISLVILDVNTKTEKVIKTYSCYNRHYFHPKVTLDGKWVYMDLQYAESLGGRDIFADRFTAFVNIETGEEYWGTFEPEE